MSPFAHHLYELRMRHCIRQNELAELLGYDQTYISALEVGLKGPPTPEFVDKLVGCLELSTTEAAAVRNAADASERKLVIDADSHPEVYLMVAALKRRLKELHPAQARIVRAVLDLPDALRQQEQEPIKRLRRRKSEEGATK
jgi:transcriptional regulator with XRE-family HTH domain